MSKLIAEKIIEFGKNAGIPTGIKGKLVRPITDEDKKQAYLLVEILDDFNQRLMDLEKKSGQ